MKKYGIPAEIDGDPLVKITKTLQMTVIIPTDDEQPVRRPGLDIPDQPRIDDAAEMIQPRTARCVLFELELIPFQQGDIPTDMLAETGVIDIPRRRLFPGIKDLDFYILLSKPH
jgi:hypothetical protein